MARQVEIEKKFMVTHREFIENLEGAVEMLEKDIDEAGHMKKICTDEWCTATESVIDELHKSIYSISEPRWSSDEDTKKLANLRYRIRDLYGRYKTVSA
jgi:archaellum component FlaC